MINMKIVPSRLEQFMNILGLNQTDISDLLQCDVHTVKNYLKTGGKYLNITGVYNLVSISDDAIKFLVGDILNLSVNRRMVNRLLKEAREGNK